MQRFEQERLKQINEIVAVMRIIAAGLILISIIIILPYESFESNLQITSWAMVMCAVLGVLYKAWAYFQKHTDTSTRMVWLDKAGLFTTMIVITVVIYLSGAHQSNYKILLLIPVIINSIRFGTAAGIVAALLATSSIIFNDLIKNLGLERNVYLEGDLILVGVIFIIAWLLGNFVETEAKFRHKLALLANQDELTGLYNHRYFQERLDVEIKLASEKNNPLSLIFFDIDFFKFYNDSYGHQAGDNLLKQISNLVLQIVGDKGVAARYGGDEFGIILPNTNAKQALEIAEAIRKSIEERTFMGEESQPQGKITISAGIASVPENAFDRNDLLRKADEALYKAKFLNKNKVEIYFSVLDELKQELNHSETNLINTIKTLITVINAKDRYTYGHSERVVIYCKLIAQEMKLTPHEKKILEYAAYLHDVGKIEIDREILNKREGLDEKEWKILMQHPSWGADIIRPVDSLKEILPIVLHHHERYDGTGYPAGLKGDEIPLLARILTVADSFDAMTSSRPYKRRKTFEAAIQELIEYSGTQFHPEVIEAFIRALKKEKIISFEEAVS
jgi:diguanylate cyclase (GGDEF)-like protein